MPKISLSHRTSLTGSEIKEKAEKMIPEALEKFGDKVSDIHQVWIGNTLEFSLKVMRRFSVSGKAMAKDGIITVEVKIPLAAIPFKGKIEEKIREKARELFS